MFKISRKYWHIFIVSVRICKLVVHMFNFGAWFYMDCLDWQLILRSSNPWSQISIKESLSINDWNYFTSILIFPNDPSCLDIFPQPWSSLLRSVSSSSSSNLHGPWRPLTSRISPLSSPRGLYLSAPFVLLLILQLFVCLLIIFKSIIYLLCILLLLWILKLHVYDSLIAFALSHRPWSSSPKPSSACSCPLPSKFSFPSS